MDYPAGHGKIGTRQLLLVGFFVCLFAAGYVFFSNSSWWTASISQVVTISAVVPEKKYVEDFNHAEGGVATLDNRDATRVDFNFPADFNADDTTLQATSHANDFFKAEKPAPAGQAFVGKTYNFDLYDVASGDQVHTVMKPVTITINYSAADVVGVGESTLTPYRREAEDSEWQLISGSVVDPVIRSITFSTGQFSSFAVFGTPTAVASSSARSIGGGGGGSGQFITSIVKKITDTISPVTTPAAKPSGKVLLTKDLRLGARDNEVKLLQVYLNTHGFIIKTSGPGSPGKETNYFGKFTGKAVIDFQEANMSEILKPTFKAGTGFVGPKTRNYINSHP